ncbi:lactonase family protein [Bryocella elongata]|nr:lactonase family protein [Bryocella elongata]
MQKRGVFRALALAAVGVCVSLGTATLTGCSNFFVCQKSSCTSSSTTTGTGDYVYVSNSSSGSTYVSAYEIGTGTLTAISGSPYNLSYVPVAMAVSPNDASLYVVAAAGSTYSGLYRYPITTSTGAISTGSELESGNFSAMAISADGNFLFTLDSSTGTILTQYTLNTSTGAVTAVATFTTPGGPSGVGCPVSSATPSSATCAVATSPSENYVAVSLGTNGTVIFPYTSSAGITANYTGYIASPSTASGDYSAAFDASGYMYIARTIELTPYTSLAATTPTAGTSITFSSGMVPRSVTLSTAYGYLYTADEGASEISAFSLSSGALSQLTGSPITAPTYVSALAADRSGTYLLAAGYNASTGLEMFPISTTGLSTAVASEATGTTTTIPVVMAVSH